MRIDLKAMTHHQLNRLIARAKQRKARLEKERIAKIREKIRAVIESEGLALEEVLGELYKSRYAVVSGASKKSRG